MFAATAARASAGLMPGGKANTSAASEGGFRDRTGAVDDGSFAGSGAGSPALGWARWGPYDVGRLPVLGLRARGRWPRVRVSPPDAGAERRCQARAAGRVKKPMAMPSATEKMANRDQHGGEVDAAGGAGIAWRWLQ